MKGMKAWIVMKNYEKIKINDSYESYESPDRNENYRNENYERINRQ
jgi:hypothetical protein